MEIAKDKQLRLFVKVMSHQTSLQPSQPNRFPFNLDEHVSTIACTDHSQPQTQDQQVLEVELDPDEVSMPPINFNMVSACSLFFPRGSENYVDQVLKHHSIETELFARVEEKEISIAIFAEFKIPLETINGFTDKYSRTVFVCLDQRWNDPETGKLNESWEVSCVIFQGRLCIEKLSQHDIEGALEIDKKCFVLKFVIKEGRLTSSQYRGKGLADKVLTCSYFYPDQQGVFEKVQDYRFGQLKDNNPHGSSNHEKFDTRNTFYDGIFVEGKIHSGALPEIQEIRNGEATITYSENQSNSSFNNYAQIEMTGEIQSRSMEGTFLPKKSINFLTFHENDGSYTEGYFGGVRINEIKQGVVKDKFGKVVVNEILFETAAKSYLSLTVVRVGGGHLSPEQEQFVDSAVRLCNKLAFPYEEDYEPPRSTHQLSEEEFEAWTGKVSTGSEPKIVHVVLLPECRTSRKHLDHLAQRLAETDTLIVSDFCSEQTMKQFYDNLLFLDRTIVTISPISKSRLLICFRHWIIEVALRQCSKSVIVLIESKKLDYEAIIHNSRVLTVKLKAKLND